LGRTVVYGPRREPLPPARMTARRVTDVPVGSPFKRLSPGAYACSPMRIMWKVLYWLAVLAISVVLLVVLMMWFESRDASKVQDSALAPALA
jgi:hypothetical protein